MISGIKDNNLWKCQSNLNVMVWKHTLIAIPFKSLTSWWICALHRLMLCRGIFPYVYIVPLHFSSSTFLMTVYVYTYLTFSSYLISPCMVLDISPYIPSLAPVALSRTINWCQGFRWLKCWKQKKRTNTIFQLDLSLVASRQPVQWVCDPKFFWCKR